MPKPRPIKERIIASVTKQGGWGDYHQTMRDVFPDDQFPRAWRYSSNGGPPGCAMAFNRALREMGVYIDYNNARRLRLPSGLRPTEQSPPVCGDSDRVRGIAADA